MRTGRPRKPLEISDEERLKLRIIAFRPKSAQAKAMRARIILDCAQGSSNSEVAAKLHVTGATVGKWRERFRQLRLEGLLDEPRVGAPRTITDCQVEDVVTRTLESMPANSTHWSTRRWPPRPASHRPPLYGSARRWAPTPSRGELPIF